MPVAIRTVTVTIPTGAGHKNIDDKAFFPSKVNDAGVAINGFNLDFTGSQVDRHINVVHVDVDILTISGTTVEFRAHCNYADWNFDDPYVGSISVLVVADVQ
jgi:hypothetical protein